ncbi:MAG TPA: hypothetical protein VNB90_04705 [Cytophagaceae bacterium]|nr:hypothetical protein [Cytophagaceae bacterium]
MKLPEELTTRTIDKIAQEFLDEFSLNSKIIVSSALIEKIDATGIQFLISLIKLSIQNNANVALDLSISKDNKSLLERNGFKEMFNYITVH